MFLAEPLKGIELDEIAHDTGPRFPSYCLEQAQFDPPRRLAALDAQVRTDFAQAQCIRAEMRTFPAIEKVIKALCAIAESKRGGVDTVVRDVLDQFLRPFRLEIVPGYRPGPLDPVPGHEIPASALVSPGQGGQLFANGNRMFSFGA